MLNHIAGFSNSVARVYLLVQKTSKDDAWSYFSIVQDLTVTPVLCSLLLPRSKAVRSERYGSRLVGWLRAWDARLVAWTLPRAGRIIAVTALVVVMAIISVAFFGREFLPPFNEGTATVNVLASPGTSLVNRTASEAPPSCYCFPCPR